MSLLPPADHHKYRVAEKKLYGVEGSSTFLECIPKSLQARVTWTFQKHPQNPREEVRGMGESGEVTALTKTLSRITKGSVYISVGGRQICQAHLSFALSDQLPAVKTVNLICNKFDTVTDR